MLESDRFQVFVCVTFIVLPDLMLDDHVCVRCLPICSSYLRKTMKDYVIMLESNETSSCAVMLVIYHADCGHINIEVYLQPFCFNLVLSTCFAELMTVDTAVYFS